MALAQYRLNNSKIDQQRAIEHLIQARSFWINLTEAMEKYNVTLFPYQFDQDSLGGSILKRLSMILLSPGNDQI